MKRCPTCDRTFDDAMRFCQTDGTPLVEAADESQPEDPLKTTVVRQEDVASSIPPADPFKTMVGGSMNREEDDDVLQLPEEIDPMKTMVVPPLAGQDRSKNAPPKEEVRLDVPPPPFASSSRAQREEKGEDEGSEASTVMQPELPKFSEPDLSPPSFGDLSSKEVPPPKPSSNPSGFPGFGEPNRSEESSKPKDNVGQPPFEKPGTEGIPSPFGGTPKSPFEAPSSPFDQPAQSSFEPTPFNEPESQNRKDEPFFGGGQPKPFEEPKSPQFGQNDPFNQPFGGNQPLQNSEWTPPPSPVASWQDQEVGQNTPFQPPVATQGLNQTLPIVSLVFGIISICCYISPLTGLVALVTGFMGMKNANNDPSRFGGKGLAIAGMAVGGVFFLLGLLYWLYIIFVIGAIATMPNY